jgi:hypothetical protein
MRHDSRYYCWLRSKENCHDITEILLKVASNTITSKEKGKTEKTEKYA